MDIEGEGDQTAQPDPALRGRPEPPPVGRMYPGMYVSPIPFGSPPEQPVTLVGEIPWELRE